MDFNSIKLIIKKYGLIDWICAAILFCIAFVVDTLSFPDDFIPYISTDISNPLKTTTISYAILLVIVFVIGALAVVAIWFVFSPELTVFKILATYLFTISLAMCISSSLKYTVGRPRPDTTEFCGDDGSYLQCRTVLSSSDLKRQFRSFPSNHATLSMAAAVFLTLLLSEIWPSYNMLAALIKLLPVCFSLYIGSSRIWDRQQHPDDVIMGFFIGALVSLFVFKSLNTEIQLEQKSKNPLGTELSTATANSAIQMRGYI